MGEHSPQQPCFLYSVDRRLHCKKEQNVNIICTAPYYRWNELSSHLLDGFAEVVLITVARRRVPRFIIVFANLRV